MTFRSLIGGAVLALLQAAAPSWAADPCADWVPQAKPQNASRDIVGQELDQILDRGFMTFALYEDYPPYSWKDGSTPKGVDVEIARMIAEYVGVEPRFNFVAAGEDLQADLRNNIWKGPLIGGAVSNVMMRIPYDSAFKCRVEQVVFTGQYAGEALAIAFRKSAYPEADDRPTPAYFRFDTVGVENDSIADFYLTSFAGGQTSANIHRYGTMAQAMEALDAGEIMAVMGPRGQLEYGLTEATDLHQPPLPGLAVGDWTLGVGVNFRYRPLSYTVDDAIFAGLQSGEIAEIYAQYGLTHMAPER